MIAIQTTLQQFLLSKNAFLLWSSRTKTTSEEKTEWETSKAHCAPKRLVTLKHAMH